MDSRTFRGMEANVSLEQVKSDLNEFMEESTKRPSKESAIEMPPDMLADAMEQCEPEKTWDECSPKAKAFRTSMDAFNLSIEAARMSDVSDAMLAKAATMLQYSVSLAEEEVTAPYEDKVN